MGGQFVTHREVYEALQSAGLAGRLDYGVSIASCSKHPKYECWDKRNDCPGDTSVIFISNPNETDNGENIVHLHEVD